MATVGDPFLTQGPACISFSGGRTSAYMLRRILDAHGGALPSDVHVLFANTGKERQETLDFVRDVGARWGVRVRWVELHIEADGERLKHGFREVDYDSASRNGEPFAAMIDARSYLPNPLTRICTQELKIRPMKCFAMQVAGFDHWTNVIGLRADERRRVAKVTKPTRERWDNECPLAAAGVSKAHVLAFWEAQPFDLQLRQEEGNCDLCFMKGRDKIERIIRSNPGLADWWVAQESKPFGVRRDDARFRHDRPSYARMLNLVARSPLLPIFQPEEDTLPCACTD